MKQFGPYQKTIFVKINLTEATETKKEIMEESSYIVNITSIKEINLFIQMLLLIFAVDGLMVIWFRGSSFATLRAICQAWSEIEILNGVPGSQVAFFSRQNLSLLLKRFIGSLMSCPICLPFHLTFWLYIVGTYCFTVGSVTVYVLAVGGAAGRLFDLLNIDNQELYEKSNYVTRYPNIFETRAPSVRNTRENGSNEN